MKKQRSSKSPSFRYKSEFMRSLASAPSNVSNQSILNIISDGLELESHDPKYITDIIKKI